MSEAQDVDDVGFVEKVAPMVSVLNRLADVYDDAGNRHGNSTTSESRAMGELAQAHEKPPWTWPDPAHEAHVAAGMLTFAGVDHVRSYAHLFASPPIPNYSHIAVARAAIEAFGWGRWLADPAVNMGTRVKRGQLWSLADALQRKRYPQAEMKALAKTIIDRTREGAPVEWTIVCNDGRVLVGGEELPTSKAILNVVLGMSGPPGNDSQTATLWSMLSGTSHSVRYALALAMDFPDEVSTLEPPLVPFGTNSRSVHFVGALLARACINAVDAYLNLVGWVTDEWKAAVNIGDAYINAVVEARTT